MTKTWSYYPNELSDGEYKPRPKKKRLPSWKAPEHVRLTSDMKRDWPRDDWGFPLRGAARDELLLDARPTIMVPERKTKKPF